MSDKLLYRELSFRIIGAAMEVHRVLGPGFLESVYEEALAHEFDLRGILFERQTDLTIHYKEIMPVIFGLTSWLMKKLWSS